MKIKKRITLTTHIWQERKPGPLLKDEVKQLTDFFIALMDLAPQESIKVWVCNDSGN